MAKKKEDARSDAPGETSDKSNLSPNGHSSDPSARETSTQSLSVDTTPSSSTAALSSSSAKKFSARLQDIRTSASKVQPLTNAQKRRFYFKAEMLWQAVQDGLPVDDPDHDSLLAAIDSFESEMLSLNPVRLASSFLPRILQRVDMLVRMVTCCVFFCLMGVLTFLPMITIAPILDSLLKLVGWPHQYLTNALFQKAVGRGFLYLAGVFYTEEGKAKGGYRTPLVVLFQHGSNLDGFLFLDSFPQFFKSIGKDDIYLMPYVGWLAYVIATLPIDRRHRNEAIKQLGRATRACASGTAVALSPEGTRSKTGQLMRFKKGPFYVQAESRASIAPVVIQGTFELWPPKYFFTCPGQVCMNYLPPIDPDSLPAKVGKNKEELSRFVRRQMFDAIEDLTAEASSGGKGRNPSAAPLTWFQRALNVVSICLFWWVVRIVWLLVTSVSDARGVSRAALAGAFLSYTITVTASLYILYCKRPASL